MRRRQDTRKCSGRQKKQARNWETKAEGMLLRS